MANQFSRAVQDPVFWEGMGNAFREAPENIADKLRKIGTIPEEADKVARRKYPDSGRDASTQNAFRHALGTGMLARELGGGYVGSQIAKGVGYAWEGMGIMDYLNSEEHRNDTRHDLNANAVGAKAARNSMTNKELIKRLEARANSARTEGPPSVYESSPGYMTRSEK